MHLRRQIPKVFHAYGMHKRVLMWFNFDCNAHHYLYEEDVNETLRAWPFSHLVCPVID